MLSGVILSRNHAILRDLSSYGHDVGRGNYFLEVGLSLNGVFGRLTGFVLTIASGRVKFA